MPTGRGFQEHFTVRSRSIDGMMMMMMKKTRVDATLYAGTVWRTRAAAVYIIKSLCRLNGRRIPLVPHVPLSRARVYERTTAVRAWVRRQIFGVFLGRRRATGSGGRREVCGRKRGGRFGDGMTGVLAYADIYWVERIKGLVRDAGGVGHPILLRILITTPPPRMIRRPRPSSVPPGRPRGNKVKNRVSRPSAAVALLFYIRTYTGREHLLSFPYKTQRIIYTYIIIFSPVGKSLHTKIPFRYVVLVCSSIFQTRLNPPP